MLSENYFDKQFLAFQFSLSIESVFDKLTKEQLKTLKIKKQISKGQIPLQPPQTSEIIVDYSYW